MTHSFHARRILVRHILAGSIAVLAASAPDADATAITWGNVGSDWNTAGNWVGLAAPANSTATDTAIFDATGAGNNTVNIATNRSIGGLTFNVGANAYTLTNSGSAAFTIGSAGGITDNAANLQTISAPIITSASQAWTTGSGATLSIGGVVDLNGTTTTSRTLSLTGLGAIILNNTVQNSFAGNAGCSVTINLSTGGSVVMAGANTYTGATTITAGTLTLKNQLALQSSTLTMGTAVTTPTPTVVFDSSVAGNAFTIGALSGSSTTAGISLQNNLGTAITLTIAGTNTASVTYSSTALLTGSGSIIKNGAGIQVLSGANTFSGGFTLNTGTLAVGASAGAVGAIMNSGIGTGALAINGGTITSSSTAARSIFNALTFGGNVAFGDATNNGALTFAAAGDLGGAPRTLTNTNGSGDVTFSGNLSNGGVTKAGTGKLTLAGANTYSGGTLLSNGTLILGSSSTFAGGVVTNGPVGTGAVTLTNGVTVDPLTTNRIWGASSFIINGDVNLGTTATTGRVLLAGPIDLGGGTRALTLFRNGTALGLLTSGTEAFKLLQQSGGPAVTVANGTLRLVADASVTTTFTAAQFDITAGTPLTFTGNAGLTIGNRVLSFLRASDVFGTGGNTGPKVTVEAGGYFNLNDGATNSRSVSAFSIAGAGTVTNLDTNGGTSILTITGSDTTTFSGSLTNGSDLNGALTLTTVTNSLVGLTHAGGGTLNLTGNNTNTGGTIVSSGVVVLGHATNTLADTGAVTVSGGELRLGANNDTVGAVTISSGSITGTGGTLTGASYALTDTGTVSANLAGAVTLTKTGTGTAILSGTNTYNGSTTVSGGTLAISGSITGTTGVTVTAGSVQLSAASEAINDAAPLSLSTGTSLAFAPGLSSRTETVDSLALSGNAILDFGNGNTNQFTFTNGISGLGGFTLAVWNWSGPVGNIAQDHLALGGTLLSPSELGRISFFADNGLTSIGTGGEISFTGPIFEIVPVPEPSSTALLGALALLRFASRRDRRCRDVKEGR